MAAVPLPTIVLAILTSVPFGLAIRDTATGKYTLEDHERRLDHGDDDGADDGDDVEDEDYREVASRRAAEEVAHRAAVAEQEALEEEARQERDRLVKSLYGAEVATLGSAFEAIELGGPIGSGAVRSTDELDLMLLDDGLTTHTLFIKLQRDPDREDGDLMCGALTRQLREAWGTPKKLGTTTIWSNPHTSIRAVLDIGACELRYEKVTDVATWISKSESSLVPMWAVGKPAARLIEALGERTSSTADDDQITWTVRGIGVGSGPTQMIADVRGGKIVSVVASVQTDLTTQEHVVTRISEITGAAVGDDLIWPTSPKITMQQGARQMFVTIGTPPAP